MMLSDHFQDALSFVIGLHKGQLRKGSQTPYVAHLLAVAAIVLENGGDVENGLHVFKFICNHYAWTVIGIHK